MNRKLWMNPQEAAVSLGISVKTLRRWDKAGKLHVARTAGNHWRIGMADRAHANPRRKKALPILVSKSEQEERAA
jgi:excisionase family DNA binding protein